MEHGKPYTADMGNGFVPWRRDIRYDPAKETPIAPLIERFDFVENSKRWSAKFRFGLFEINDHDMQVIARAMQVNFQSLGF